MRDKLRNKTFIGIVEDKLRWKVFRVRACD
jgi:hypothetical protein